MIQASDLKKIYLLFIVYVFDNVQFKILQQINGKKKKCVERNSLKNSAKNITEYLLKKIYKLFSSCFQKFSVVPLKLFLFFKGISYNCGNTNRHTDMQTSK